ncbi:hypothetical protein A3Q56_04302 [Intoshia linei]|uniref:Uncharacterized protein n=1 Tax=Intoshia linei TaxID=1819745 RepID=A0A177B2X1_9BILA|nr:hypothetical protein A3Q56_04302 [Intoshia linei]
MSISDSHEDAFNTIPISGNLENENLNMNIQKNKLNEKFPSQENQTVKVKKDPLNGAVICFIRQLMNERIRMVPISPNDMPIYEDVKEKGRFKVKTKSKQFTRGNWNCLDYSPTQEFNFCFGNIGDDVSRNFNDKVKDKQKNVNAAEVNTFVRKISNDNSQKFINNMTNQNVTHGISNPNFVSIMSISSQTNELNSRNYDDSNVVKAHNNNTDIKKQKNALYTGNISVDYANSMKFNSSLINTVKAHSTMHIDHKETLLDLSTKNKTEVKFKKEFDAQNDISSTFKKDKVPKEDCFKCGSKIDIPKTEINSTKNVCIAGKKDKNSFKLDKERIKITENPACIKKEKKEGEIQKCISVKMDKLTINDLPDVKKFIPKKEKIDQVSINKKNLKKDCIDSQISLPLKKDKILKEQIENQLNITKKSKIIRKESAESFVSNANKIDKPKDVDAHICVSLKNEKQASKDSEIQIIKKNVKLKKDCDAGFLNATKKEKYFKDICENVTIKKERLLKESDNQPCLKKDKLMKENDNFKGEVNKTAPKEIEIQSFIRKEKTREKDGQITVLKKVKTVHKDLENAINASKKEKIVKETNEAQICKKDKKEEFHKEARKEPKKEKTHAHLREKINQHPDLTKKDSRDKILKKDDTTKYKNEMKFAAPATKCQRTESVSQIPEKEKKYKNPNYATVPNIKTLQPNAKCKNDGIISPTSKTEFDKIFVQIEEKIIKPSDPDSYDFGSKILDVNNLIFQNFTIKKDLKNKRDESTNIPDPIKNIKIPNISVINEKLNESENYNPIFTQKYFSSIESTMQIIKNNIANEVKGLKDQINNLQMDNKQMSIENHFLKSRADSDTLNNLKNMHFRKNIDDHDKR